MVVVYLLIAAAIVVIDQAVKYWTVANIALDGVVPVWDGVIHLTYIKNTGAAFSMLSDYTWLLTAISCLSAVLIVILFFTKVVNKAEKLTLAFILGGAIGNLIDRVRLGFVVDMFEVEFMEFAVFNVADIFITCFGILFGLLIIVDIIKEEREKKIMRSSHMPELERLKKNIQNEETAAEDENGGETV